MTRRYLIPSLVLCAVCLDLGSLYVTELQIKAYRATERMELYRREALILRRSPGLFYATQVTDDEYRMYQDFFTHIARYDTMMRERAE